MILKMRLARLVSYKALFWVSYRFWYIDDISNSSNQFIFFLFADFTNLLFYIRIKSKTRVWQIKFGEFSSVDISETRIDYDWLKLNFLTNESNVNPSISYKGKNMLNTSAFLMIVAKQSLGSTT